MMHISKSGIRGLFKIEVEQTDDEGKIIEGSRKVVAPWQDNLLTDSGLDNMASSGFMSRCHLGAGNNAPSESDTVLQSPIADKGGSVDAGPVGDDFVSIVGTYTFQKGEAVGIIAEIGVGPSSGLLTTRALIRDENGDPTTITVGPNDVLTVTYQMREYPDQGDIVQDITNPHDDQVYSTVSRTWFGKDSRRFVIWHNWGPVNMANNGGNMPRVDNAPLLSWDAPHSLPSGAAETQNRTLAPYVNGSHYRELTAVWDESLANGITGGITRLTIGNPIINQYSNQALALQTSFDPPIMKDSTKVLTLRMRKAWGRYSP